MKLSVIIPCLNAAGTITVQLKALSDQEWSEPWEVIISDNGSTDHLLAVVSQYRDRFPNLRVFDSSDKRGRAHALNVAARQAFGESLAFCDADDEVAPGWVATMGEALVTHDFVAGRLDAEKLNEAWAIRSRTCPQQCGLQEYRYPPFLPHAAGCNIGVKRVVHLAVGGFDEDLLRTQDTDYCWRIQLAGTHLRFVPDALVHYRFRDSLSAMCWQAYLWGEYNVFMYKKYRPLGMPKLLWQVEARSWLDLTRSLLQIFHSEKRVGWLWRFSYHLGRMWGNVKYRILAPRDPSNHWSREQINA